MNNYLRTFLCKVNDIIKFNKLNPLFLDIANGVYKTLNHAFLNCFCHQKIYLCQNTSVYNNS